MAIYFSFSDECGDYKPFPTEKQLSNHPFYIRSTLIINGDEWRQLNNNFRELKAIFKIPLSLEIKWANIWSLKHFQTHNKPIPSKRKDLKPLEPFDYLDLLEFCRASVNLVSNLKEKQIILTYSVNSKSNFINEMAMLKMHLQEHLQRIEMQIQNKEENLSILFFDPVSHDKNEHFRALYYELFENGDIVQYKHIKDSLNIENSHHSVGIQIADYISGSFSAMLKHGGPVDYSLGVEIFLKQVFPHLRKLNSNIWGIGIREVPKSIENRQWLKQQIQRYNT